MPNKKQITNNANTYLIDKKPDNEANLAYSSIFIFVSVSVSVTVSVITLLFYEVKQSVITIHCNNLNNSQNRLNPLL